MTLTWAAFESALDGHRDAPGALDALITSSMHDVQATLDGIGASEAGPLLAKAQAADSPERRSKLAASLEAIDRQLPVDGRVTKRALFGRRQVLTDQFTPSSDLTRSALLAALIDSELGGDPERLRTRLAMAATGMESTLAADLSGLSKSERGNELSAARRVLQSVIQVLLSDLQSRKAS